MVTFHTLQRLAASFPEVEEQPHFEKTSFRVKNKIFATYDPKENRATVKLSEIDQDVFASADTGSIYPVNNKWRKQGWTFIELAHVNEDLFLDAITTSYCEVAPKRLAEQVRPAEKE